MLLEPDVQAAGRLFLVPLARVMLVAAGRRHRARCRTHSVIETLSFIVLAVAIAAVFSIFRVFSIAFIPLRMDRFSEMIFP